VDLTSEYGQNYAIHSAWLRATFDGTPWTQPELYRAQSPITYISRVRTPVIMRYGGRSSTDDNIRQSYMLAQGFELYAGLRDTGVPVQFVLHPDQGHGIIDRDLYWDWVMRNIGWFDYWLLHEGTNPTADLR
jgi:dipeptidyl aminopeptidase/acylaminoacyl peptidase